MNMQMEWSAVFNDAFQDSLIVALKSEEKDGKPVASYISVFDLHGHVIMEDQKLEGSYKFEGLAFVTVQWRQRFIEI